MDIDNLLEQVTVSPSVHQITVDYLYVRRKLIDEGVPTDNDMGQDIALSIVCDAYQHSNHKLHLVRLPPDDDGND